jgi:hypothetical protein
MPGGSFSNDESPMPMFCSDFKGSLDTLPSNLSASSGNNDSSLRYTGPGKSPKARQNRHSCTFPAGVSRSQSPARTNWLEATLRRTQGGVHAARQALKDPGAGQTANSGESPALSEISGNRRASLPCETNQWKGGRDRAEPRRNDPATPLRAKLKPVKLVPKLETESAQEFLRQRALSLRPVSSVKKQLENIAAPLAKVRSRSVDGMGDMLG